DQHDVNLPVICCTCYAGLEHGTFESTSKRRMILFFISFVTSIYFLSIYVVPIFSFTWSSILVIIIPFVFWGYISYRDLKSIYYLRKGRKYYKKFQKAPTTHQVMNINQNLIIIHRFSLFEALYFFFGEQ
ncbi:MAG: hypothetical protein ACTSPA_10945, partial [Promethearchaeota archaeon]